MSTDYAPRSTTWTRATHVGGRRVLAWLLAALLIGLVCISGADADQAAATKPSGPPEIPMALVAARATEVPELLRLLTESLAPSAEIATIRTRLPELSRRIDSEIEAATRILEGHPPLDVLQAQQQMWQRQQVLTTAWLGVLTHHATLLQDGLNRLAEIKQTWQRTRNAAVSSSAPGPILLQIDGVLAAITAAETPLAAQRASVLDLQTSVANEVARSGNVLALFTQAQQRAVV